MAVKKKRKPYDPFNPYGNHSLAWYQQEASRRAGQDVQNQVNALPSAGFYTSSSQQLADALGKIQKNQAGLAAQSGGLYNQAYQNAAEPANRATMVAGGQVQNQAPGAGDLLTALGTGSALAMGGLQTAATARGNQLVQDRAKQESTIRGGLQASTDKYLQQMRDDALQAAVQRFNNQLAGQQFGLQASNTAFDNNLAAAQLDAQVAGNSSKASAKQSAKLQKLMSAARKAANTTLNTGTTSKKVTGRQYLFIVPAEATGSADTAGKQVWVTASSGPDALVQIAKQFPGDKFNYRNWFTNQTKDITTDVNVKGSRTAALHAAAAIFEDAGYSHALSLRYARRIISSKKKRGKPQGSTATSSQSR